MGIQRVVLEDHSDVSVLGRNVIDALTVDVQVAARDIFQTGDHAQGGGLAAARRADQNDEFLVLNIQIKGLHGNDTFVGHLQRELLVLCTLLFLLGLVVRVHFLYILQNDLCHFGISSS